MICLIFKNFQKSKQLQMCIWTEQRSLYTFKLEHDISEQISDTLYSESINNYFLFLILFKSAGTTECLFPVNSVTHCFMLDIKEKH